MAAPVSERDPSTLDLERDFERLRGAARRRFLARARRAGQHAFHDLEEAADDAYQEAWLELARRPAAAVDDPVAYLAGIMWHRFHRRELRSAPPPAVPLEDGVGGLEAAPDDLVLQRETLRLTREALGEVPERERIAVLLRALGLGHRDVAASLDVSPRRARKLSDAGHRSLLAALDTAGTGARCAGMASTLRALALGWPITRGRRGRLESHLTGCSACRATVAALRHEGRLAALPIALAGTGRLDAVRAWLENAARLWSGAPSGQAEAGAGAVAGVAAGGALAAKLAAGCLTVGIAGGCVAAVVATDGSEPRPSGAFRAEAAVPGEARRQATARAATTRTLAERASSRDAGDGGRPAGGRVRKAGERARRAGDEVVRAGRRARRAGEEAVQAGRRARRAGEEAVQAGQRARDAGQEATRAGQQATNAGQEAASTGQQAADTGRRASQDINAAADKTRDAARSVQDALGSLGR